MAGVAGRASQRVVGDCANIVPHGLAFLVSHKCGCAE